MIGDFSPSHLPPFETSPTLPLSTTTPNSAAPTPTPPHLSAANISETSTNGESCIPQNVPMSSNPNENCSVSAGLIQKLSSSALPAQPSAIPHAYPSGKKPWSSVLNGTDRDRTRPTAVVMTDGRAHTSIPDEILSEAPPLWENYIVGHFIGEASPHIGKVHATVNRLWTSQDSKAKIDAHFLNPKSVLFRIENAQTRLRVLRRHFWHISDIPMVVQAWNPNTAKSKPDLSSIPIWVDFKNVPQQLFSRKGLLFLGDIIGIAQKIHPSTERCTRLDMARVLVEVDLSKELPEMICLQAESEVQVTVNYPWLPPKCISCGIWGHLDKECNQMKKGHAIQKEHTEMLPGVTMERNHGMVTAEQSKSGSHDVIDAAPGNLTNSPVPSDDPESSLTQVQTTEHSWTLVTRKRKSPKKSSPLHQIPEEEPTPLVPVTVLALEETGTIDREEGEIQATPTEEEDVEPQSQLQPKQGGNLRSGNSRSRNTAKSPSVYLKDTGKVTRQNTNKKSSSRKA